jgi:PAS domain S-box-containing protein
MTRRSIEERMAAMFLADVPLGFLAIDSELRVVWANESAARLVGWTRQGLIGRSGFDLIHPEDLPMVAGSLALVSSGRPPLSTIFRVIAEDENSCTPIGRRSRQSSAARR